MCLVSSFNLQLSNGWDAAAKLRKNSEKTALFTDFLAVCRAFMCFAGTESLLFALSLSLFL